MKTRPPQPSQHSGRHGQRQWPRVEGNTRQHQQQNKELCIATKLHNEAPVCERTTPSQPPLRIQTMAQLPTLPTKHSRCLVTSRMVPRGKPSQSLSTRKRMARKPRPAHTGTPREPMPAPPPAPTPAHRHPPTQEPHGHGAQAPAGPHGHPPPREPVAAPPPAPTPTHRHPPTQEPHVPRRRRAVLGLLHRQPQHVLRHVWPEELARREPLLEGRERPNHARWRLGRRRARHGGCAEGHRNTTSANTEMGGWERGPGKGMAGWWRQRGEEGVGGGEADEQGPSVEAVGNPRSHEVRDSPDLRYKPSSSTH